LEGKVNFRSFLTLFVLIISASTACAQDAKKTADDFAAKWVAAYDAGDAAALAAMFTQDGVFNAPSGAVVKGREAIEKALAGRMKAGWTKETARRTTPGRPGTPFGLRVIMLCWAPAKLRANRPADASAG
jgi:hypothetical protein